MNQFALFCIAGTLGFAVEARGVQALVSWVGLDALLARLISFLCAVTTTWLFNRRFTFVSTREEGALREGARYLGAMLGGFGVNYAVYAALVIGFAQVRNWPVLGVAAGSIAGLIVNYVSSRYWVFRHPPSRDA
jgi:putative flippase GtrA